MLEGDFLDCFGLGKFPRIIMNPPFANGDDIMHIIHALRCLAPGGRLVAPLRQRTTPERPAPAIVEEHGGTWEELPADTFQAAGTSVRTVLLTVPK